MWSLPRRRVRFAILVVVLLAHGTTVPRAVHGAPAEKRPARVADSIGMTWIGEPNAEFEVDTPSAVFAPDGRSFVVVTRRGNLRKDSNDYSLLQFRRGLGGWILPPHVVVKMSSSSNSPGIDNVKWLADGKTLMFI